MTVCIERPAGEFQVRLGLSPEPCKGLGGTSG